MKLGEGEDKNEEKMIQIRKWDKVPLIAEF